MTFAVKKSFLRANPWFEAAVAAHAKELRDWLDRERKVARDAANPNVLEEDRWVTCPRPESPNGEVESCVNEKGDVDFVVDDDDPSPEQVLASKKSHLTEIVHAEVAQARNYLIPVNKRPLREIRTRDIVLADQQRRNVVIGRAEKDFELKVSAYNAAVAEIEEDKPSILSRASFKIGLIEDNRAGKIASLHKPEFDVVDVESEIAKMRPYEDSAFLDENARITAADEAITRAAAQALNDIEDLTLDTIDSYRVPVFQQEA